MKTISTVLLIALALGWAWVLGRPLIQTVFNRAHRDPVGHFSRQLTTLGQAPRNSAITPSFGGPPAGYSIRQRRRQIMLALVFAAVVSLGFAVALGGIFVAQHLLIDVLLVGYVAAASRAGSLETERRQKVSYLGDASESVRPAYLRTGSDPY